MKPGLQNFKIDPTVEKKANLQPRFLEKHWKSLIFNNFLKLTKNMYNITRRSFFSDICYENKWMSLFY